MFGIWRYFLSLCVIVGHIAPLTWSWGSSKFYGMYAVFGFYVLSGYLITRVLHERYGFDSGGTVRFIANRLLRLFPTYWAAAIVALAVVIVLPEQAWQTAWGYALPDGVASWLSAAFILGTRLVEGCRLLIPQAWSLSVELVFYLLMVLVLSRYRVGALLWLAASVVGTFWFMFVRRIDFWEFGYLSNLAGSLPFSIGACLFLWGSVWRRFVRPWHIVLAAPLFLANLIFYKLIWGGAFLMGFYISMLIAAWMVVILSTFSAQKQSTLAKWDSILGDYSYPLYLIHMAAGTIANEIAKHFPSIQLATAIGLCLLGSHLFGWLAIHYIEIPIERIRRRLKPVLEPEILTCEKSNIPQ